MPPSARPATGRRHCALLMLWLAVCLPVMAGAPASTTPALAQSGAPGPTPELITRTALRFIEQQLGSSAADERLIKVSAPDPRQQLTACTQDLLGFWPANARLSGNTVVGVRCPDAGSWQLFLPVAITELQTVWVAARPLQRGEVLSRDNLHQTKVARSELRGTTYKRYEDLDGSVTRQHIAAHEPITAARICLVCRGDTVQLAAGNDSYRVRVQAIAESSANRGERVTVQNPASKRRLTAIVQGKGQVVLP